MTESKKPKAEVLPDAKALQLVVKAAQETKAIRQTVAARHDAEERKLVISLAAMMSRKSKPLSAETVKVTIQQGIKDSSSEGANFRFEYLTPHMAKYLPEVAHLMDSKDTSGKTLAELVTLVRKVQQAVRGREDIEPKNRSEATSNLIANSTLEQLEKLPALKSKPRGSRSKAENIEASKWNQAQAFGYLRNTADILGEWWSGKPQISRGESAAQTAEKLREMVNTLDAIIEALEGEF